MPHFVALSDTDSVREGEATTIAIQDYEIALFRIGEEFFALENECPHLGGPIGDGFVEDDCVRCPWHDWPFNIRTGECLINPAARLRQFQTRIVGKEIQVSLPGE